MISVIIRVYFDIGWNSVFLNVHIQFQLDFSIDISDVGMFRNGFGYFSGQISVSNFRIGSNGGIYM